MSVDRLTLARAALLRADLARDAGDMLAALDAMEAARAHLAVAIDAAREGTVDEIAAALRESVAITRRGGGVALLRVVRGGKRG